MKDHFTKAMLAIISICLSLLTAKELDLMPIAYAGAPSESPSLKYGLVPLNEDGSITVRISPANELDVNLVGISTSDELDVNIDEIGGRYVYNGTVPVEVK